MGYPIWVQGDKWIPNHLTNKIMQPPNDDVEDWVVSDLIDHDLHAWRTDVVMAMFHSEGTDAICKILLSQSYVSDSIIWLLNNNGRFIVKSAYRVARQVLKDV